MLGMRHPSHTASRVTVEEGKLKAKEQVILFVVLLGENPVRVLTDTRCFINT